MMTNLLEANGEAKAFEEKGFVNHVRVYLIG
jgi:hypothetical protein